MDLSRGVALPYTVLSYGRHERTPRLEWLLPDLKADQRHKSYGERLETFHRIVKASKEKGFVIDQEEAGAIEAALGLEAPSRRRT